VTAVAAAVLNVEPAARTGSPAAGERFRSGPSRMSEGDRRASRNLRAIGVDSALSTRAGAAAAGSVVDEHEGRVDGSAQQVGQVPHLTREERFTQLFRAHARRVARVITAAVRPEDRANVVDDLGQETFLRVWVSLDTLDRCDEQAAGRYIAAIARNRVHSHYRDLARRHTCEAPAGPDALVWGSAAAAASDDVAAEVAEFDEHLAVITALNDGLPSEVAEVLRLRFYDEAPITDVAERIGRSRATTVRRQAEGLALLREQLASHRADTGDQADAPRPRDALARARRTVNRAEQQRAAATDRASDRAQLAAASPQTSLEDYGATRLLPALRGVADGTAEQYRAGWRQRVLPALGDRPVREIDAAAVERAVRSWTAEDVSRSTVRGARAALARVLDEAVADGLLTHNPARGTETSAADGDDRCEPKDLAGAGNLAPDHRSMTTAERPARDDRRRARQADSPAPQPITEPRHVAANRDGTTQSPEKGVATESRLAAPEPAPDRPAAAAVGALDGRNPLAGARWAVTRVGQLRADVEQQPEERSGGEQLARWHADDHAAEVDDRTIDEVAR